MSGIADNDVVYAVSYCNPDLDGVASAVALSKLLLSTEKIACIPLALGACDSETVVVFELFRVDLPQVVGECPNDGMVYLVDTHHPEQLKGKVPTDRVVRIFDHHPAGDATAFPNAEITNEPVGAVATLLAERYKESGAPITPPVAGLLYAAIVSNTLNFVAPTTTQRDHSAATWLLQLFDVPADLVRRMFEARSQYGDVSSAEIIRANAKTFTFGAIRIAISQVEGIGACALVTRADLGDGLHALRSSEKAQHAFLSFVDPAEGRTVLYACDNQTRELLKAAIHVMFDGDIAAVQRILLRKSDLVPPLMRHLESPPQEVAP